MFNPQLVLVAIDRGTDVQRTMNVALRAARSRRADVHVIRVAPHGAVRVDDRLGAWVAEAQDNPRSVASGAQRASALGSADHHRVRVRRVALRGEPEQVIPAYAQVHQAAMLVLEHDYGTSRIWRNGSVVDEIARRSPMPLLVLPKRQAREPEAAVRRVLTPVDFSIASAVAVRTAVDLSRRHGARVTLVHALNDVPQHMMFGGTEAWEMVRRLPAQVNAVAERLRRKAAVFGGDDVETEVTTGLAHGVILEAASRSEADLVVMGIAQRGWLDRLLFGSTLRRVLRRATVPVLVVPVVAGAHSWRDELDVDRGARRVWTGSAVNRAAA